MEKILFEIESKEKALPSDKSLSLWIRLQLIADDARQGTDSNEISVIGISDSKVSNWMRNVADEMSKWKTLQMNQAKSRKFVKLALKSSRVRTPAAKTEIVQVQED